MATQFRAARWGREFHVCLVWDGNVFREFQHTHQGWAEYRDKAFFII